MGCQNLDPEYCGLQRSDTDIPSPLTSLLSLIAATILADSRPSGSGGHIFLKELGALALTGTTGRKMSEAQYLLWYELNKDRIRNILVSAEFETWYYHHLARLSEITERQTVLNAMHRITSFGKPPHLNGIALLNLTQRYWHKR